MSDNVLIGMGSIILDNAEIGEYTLIGAGTLITSNKKF
ncbi:gamma carbonic anhydrase family protein, partial [Clostridioides difficile]